MLTTFSANNIYMYKYSLVCKSYKELSKIDMAEKLQNEKLEKPVFHFQKTF